MSALLIGLVLCVFPALAASAELRAGAGPDLVQQNGRTNGGLGLTYDLGRAEGWRAELGAFLAHISHGASIGIAADRANAGMNFLTFEARF